MSNNVWFLEGRDGSGKHWIVNIDQYPFTIGRSKEAMLTLSNSDISREHARIIEQKGELFIEDCSSTNGTLLNGRSVVKSSRFYENDKLHICGFEFKLIKGDGEHEDKTIISFNEAPAERFSKKYSLTPRESELLGYLVKGMSTKEIASAMFISAGTAKNHILNLLKKSNTHSRLELIRSYEETL